MQSLKCYILTLITVFCLPLETHPETSSLFRRQPQDHSYGAGESARKQQINAAHWLLCSWATWEHNWRNLECAVSRFGVLSAYWVNRMRGCQPDFRLPLLKAFLKNWNLPHPGPVLFLTYYSLTEERKQRVLWTSLKVKGKATMVGERCPVGSHYTVSHS